MVRERGAGVGLCCIELSVGIESVGYSSVAV